MFASQETKTTSSQMGTVPPNTDSSFTISWNSPEAAELQHPRNWSSTKKWLHILTVSVMAFLVPVVSSAVAPAVPQIMIDLGTNSDLFATVVVSIFVLGFSCGSAILPPLSEIYGRMPIYNVGNALFTLFTAFCGLAPKPVVLLLFRFLSGFFGVACITLGSGTIADLMIQESRGFAVAIWSAGTVLGPTLGPIIGAYSSDVWGWRWIFWLLAMIISVVTAFTMFALQETNPVIILERKAKETREKTGNSQYRSELTTFEPWQNFRNSIFRPIKLLVCEPIVTSMCFYVAVLYGILYLLFSTYSFVYTEVYGFTPLDNGLVFIAGGVGTLAGLAYMGLLSDRELKRQLARGKTMTPEHRLPWIITLPGTLTFPCGLFIYGWTCQPHIHWVVSQIGTAITGFGSIIIFASIQTYLIDAFESYAASVVGANAILRGLVGALLPLSGLRMYRQVGIGWGNSLLGFVALALAPLPWMFHLSGAKLRQMRRI